MKQINFSLTYNNVFSNPVMNNIAFKIVKGKPTMSQIVINALYNSENTANKSFELNDLIEVAKKHLMHPITKTLKMEHL